MKSLYLLLGLYVFLLTLYPCRDSDLHGDPIKDGITMISDHDHAHSGVEIDICTPFCICSCCAANINLSFPDDITISHFHHNTKLITHYLERPVLDLGNSIWQPPRA